jgi:hypothetical protein
VAKQPHLRSRHGKGEKRLVGAIGLHGGDRTRSPETVAKARFNRALAYARLNDQSKAEADLKVVIDMPGVPEQIRASAKEKLLRWGKRRGN